VLDVATADVLGFAGAPVQTQYAADVPGLEWRGNGAIGSVVKPFVLVEQLQSEREGRVHLPPGSFAPCERVFRYGDRRLRLLCDGHHGAGGRDPVEALAESCNIFFYQAGIGLGEEGLARALRRFGLLEATAGDPFAACWQPVVRGLPVAAPRMRESGAVLPRRAIGYSVEASPLHVARAYAALASGALPEIGLTTKPRRRVPLDDAIGEIGVVQEGLRACVRSGTASGLVGLRDLGVCGKTGTADVDDEHHENNAWFAGYAPCAASGMQLVFCAVVYWVPNGEHGADVAGELVSDFLASVQADSALCERYLAGGGGR
jgi:penicillin-binding protein 2